MSMRGIGSFMSLLIGITFTIAGAVLVFGFGLPLRRQAVASASWPATEGRITRSRLEMRAGDKGSSFTADVAYEYDLDGRTLVGSRVWIGDGYSSSPGTEHRDAVTRYPVGRQVQVHYDPQDPDESVLEPGPTWSSMLLLLLGLVFLSIGSLVLLFFLVPLLFVVVMAASAGGGSGGDMRDFERPATPSSRPPAERPGPGSQPDDDGIRIG